MGCGLGLGLGLGLSFTLGLDSIISGWAEEVFGGIEVANFWEFAVRLFTGNQITTRGLGFSGNEAERRFLLQKMIEMQINAQFLLKLTTVTSCEFICVLSITILLMFWEWVGLRFMSFVFFCLQQANQMIVFLCTRCVIGNF